VPTLAVASRQQIEAAVEFGGFVQHDHHGGQLRFGDPVEMPGTEILVPGPSRSLNRCFHVGFAVMQIECIVTEQLLRDPERAGRPGCRPDSG
jgi:hypothetical protein